MVMKMIETRKINVLGTEYLIAFDVSENLMPEGADGCMDQSIQTIKIAEMKPGRNSLQDLESYKKKVLRHEIIHAFLYESGLWNNSGTSDAWGQDETITDWFAIQSPKIFKAFKDADAL